MLNKKVIRIITRLNNGGPAKQAIWLSHYLNDHGYITVLLAGRTEGEEDEITDYSGKYSVQPVFINNLKRTITFLSDAVTVFHIIKYIKKYRPAIVHTHMAKAGFVGRFAVAVYNAFNRNKVKTIHTFHGHIFHSYFSKQKTLLFILLERYLAGKTDIIIAISKTQKKELLEKYKIGKKKQYRIIPLGIDYQPEYEKNNNANSMLTMGMMGRIADIKNYDLALDIAEILSRKKENITIIIAGGGDAAELSRMVKRVEVSGLGSYIQFVGNISDPAAFWKDIDVALVTSKNEGTPVALLESMMTGIPFISSRVGGIPDLSIGKPRIEGNLIMYDNCIQINSFNPNDFVKAMQYYNENRSIILQSGRCAAEYAKKKFGINRLIRDIHSIYGELTS